MSRAPHDPTETVEELRAALARNHPELTDADLDRILSGPPRTGRRTRPFLDNRGKRESVYETPSTGRTTSGHPSILGEGGG